jgi:alkylhydroperoxidase family enzyme
MKRTTLVEYENASPSVRAIYDEFMQATGEPGVLNVLKALGNNEHILRGVWEMLRSTLVEGQIPALLKQLILFRISVHAGNRYCEALHAHAACNLDPTFSYDDLIALSEGQALHKLPAAFQVAIDVVSRAALDSKSVAEESFDYEELLRDEGFSESEIDELMAQAYFGVMMNTLADAYDIPREAFDADARDPEEVPSEVAN